MNTGFGGSADTRTDQVDDLQASLVSLLQCGIMYPASVSGGLTGHFSDQSTTINLLTRGLALDDPASTNSMPDSWVRSAILVRINSLLHGVSSIRPEVVSRMADLLRLKITPRVPMHGSISASGDLSPSAYIAGCVQGKPSVSVHVGGSHRFMTADQAIADANLRPMPLEAKEGLAIVNGTAFSSGISALLMWDALGLSVLAQVLTAMSVEALAGRTESFDPFFAAVRAHPGQVGGETLGTIQRLLLTRFKIEVSQNILRFLKGSHFTSDKENLEERSLPQDRYSIRTAAQWIGPVQEDFSLAYQQVLTECNSVTDNPLTNPSGASLHGGNFQAKAITSAMEKTRQGLQSIGRMLFAQATELINPATNNGLPPNLTIDPPSQSFILKGVDIMCASLLSELGFLANPVGSHVQTAEMGNQALNSLALISARYTHTAADLLSKLCAAHLLIVCQALDLRAIKKIFLTSMADPLRALNHDTFTTSKTWPSTDPHPALWSTMIHSFNDSRSMDPSPRFPHIASTMQSTALSHLDSASTLSPLLLPLLSTWKQKLTHLLSSTYDSTTAAYLAPHGAGASPFLGAASRRLYDFVRNALKVPFLTEHGLNAGLAPSSSSNHDGTVVNEAINGDGDADGDADAGRRGVATIGDYITVLHEAIRQGVLFVPIMEALKEVQMEYGKEGEEM